MTAPSISDVELSLTVPTYNERENIVPLVQRVHRALSQYRYELIVVDDNSPDGTAELAKSLSAEYPLQVIVRTTERGLASAVVAGFGRARGEVLGVLDADLQHPPEEIPALLQTIRSGADIAIASRYVQGGGIEGWSTRRRIISRTAKIPATLLLSRARKIKDPLSGFFLFKKKVIDGAVLSPTGYKILLEVLVKGNASQVTEVPYVFKERERGKSNLTYKEQVNYLKHLARLGWYDGGMKLFLRFCVVGASGTVVYFGLLSLFTEVAGLFYALSAALAYEISIVNNFTWNELWTFRERRSSAEGTVLTRALRFNLVSLVGWAIHEAVLVLFTEVAGLHYIASAAIAIAVAMLWNFFANVRWTWRKSQATGQTSEAGRKEHP